MRIDAILCVCVASGFQFIFINFFTHIGSNFYGRQPNLENRMATFSLPNNNLHISQFVRVTITNVRMERKRGRKNEISMIVVMVACYYFLCAYECVLSIFECPNDLNCFYRVLRKAILFRSRQCLFANILSLLATIFFLFSSNRTSFLNFFSVQKEPKLETSKIKSRPKVMFKGTK